MGGGGRVVWPLSVNAYAVSTSTDLGVVDMKWPISRAKSGMMVFSAQIAEGGGGMLAHPFSPYLPPPTSYVIPSTSILSKTSEM